MAVLDSNMVVYVAQGPSRHSMRMFTEVGRRAHAHATGVGKAILAQLDDSSVRTIVMSAGMPTPTELSIGTIDGLLRDLDKVRERGYSIADGEQEVGVRCCALAVPNAPMPTAMSVSGPLAGAMTPSPNMRSRCCKRRFSPFPMMCIAQGDSLNRYSGSEGAVKHN